MPAITVPKNALSFGPGYLYYANAGVAAPTNTVVGSVFTDTWPVGWNAFGITREGHTLNVVTGRTVTAEMELMQINLTNFRRAFNGGTLSTSGSGTTLLTTYTLPNIGGEIRAQIGWESTDGTERWWAMQAFNTGSVGIQRQKGADNASLPITWTFEPDASSQPIYFAAAGTVRG